MSASDGVAAREWPLLRSVLADTGELPDVSDPDRLGAEAVTPLGGGVDAATFLVRAPGRAVVVKLNERGLEAEAETLRTWSQHSSRVPEVLGMGEVPGPAGEQRPVKYLVLAAMLDDTGDVVETAADYVERSPSRAREVGRSLGEELHRLHQAVSRRGFGNFTDTPGAERTYDTWADYLADFLRHHEDYLTGLGVTGEELTAVYRFVQGCSFVDQGRYLHGDVTIRNVAIHRHRPLAVGLFDPNPLIGDPGWDVAPLANNVEYNERRQRLDGEAPEPLRRDRDLLTGFWDSYPGEVQESSLLTSRLVQAVLQAQHREERHADRKTDPRDVQVTHDFVRDAIARMATS